MSARTCLKADLPPTARWNTRAGRQFPGVDHAAGGGQDLTASAKSHRRTERRSGRPTPVSTEPGGQAPGRRREGLPSDLDRLAPPPCPTRQLLPAYGAQELTVLKE